MFVALALVVGIATRTDAQCCNTIEFVEPVTYVEYSPMDIAWHSPVVEWDCCDAPVMMASEVVWAEPVVEYFVDPCGYVINETSFTTGDVVYESELGSLDSYNGMPMQDTVIGEVVSSPSTYTSGDSTTIEPIASEDEAVETDEDQINLEANEDVVNEDDVDELNIDDDGDGDLDDE